MTQILFADCEGDNFLEDITKLWLLQIAEGEDGEVELYADQPGYKPIREGLERLKNAEKVAFHNAFGFDYWAINKLYPGTLRFDQIIDTLILSRLMDSTSMRHNLAELGEALGFPKLHFDDFSKFSKEMVTYGKQDVVILQQAWKGNEKRKVRSFGKFYETFKRACELEFKVAFVIQKQVTHGFAFDYEAALELESKLRVEQKELERHLQEVFPPIVHERYSDKTGKRLKDRIEVFNPGSRDQIAARLIDRYGWKPKKLTPTKKPQVDESILDALPYPEAKLIASYMKLGKKLGQLADGDNAWLKLAVKDQRGSYSIHGQINTLGARTHRMSHFRPNVAQVDTDPRMRACFVADRDRVLVGCDAEGLELRELSHFLHPYDGGRYVEIVHSGDKSKGTDIHTMNKIAAGLYLRDSAKTMIYAHNYGAGDPKLGTIITDELRLIIDALTSENPTKAQLKIIEEVTGQITLAEAQYRLKSIKSLPSAGRELRSKIEVGIVGLGDLISKCKRTHHKQGAMPGHDGRWIPSNGDNSALNTLLQGNGSIVMKQALAVFDDEMTRLQLLDQFDYCANVHDEFQITSHPDISQKVAEVGKWSITRAGELLEVRCPLVGSADIGMNWSETH